MGICIESCLGGPIGTSAPRKTSNRRLEGAGFIICDHFFVKNTWSPVRSLFDYLMGSFFNRFAERFGTHIIRTN